MGGIFIQYMKPTTNVITIESTTNTATGWEFMVIVSEHDSETEHRVSLENKYYQDLTSGQMTPEDLIKNSFEFLLEREPKEEILKTFDLSLIQKYFTEYESEIKK